MVELKNSIFFCACNPCVLTAYRNPPQKTFSSYGEIGVKKRGAVRQGFTGDKKPPPALNLKQKEIIYDELHEGRGKGDMRRRPVNQRRAGESRACRTRRRGYP